MALIGLMAFGFFAMYAFDSFVVQQLYALAGSIIFSLYVVYDTWVITQVSVRVRVRVRVKVRVRVRVRVRISPYSRTAVCHLLPIRRVRHLGHLTLTITLTLTVTHHAG